MSDAPSGEEDTPTTPTDKTPPSGECGDAGAHGFWQRSHTAIFDVRIMDTQSHSYWNKDYQKVLAQQEKEKKNQYLCPCLEMRKDFTPLATLLMALQGRRLRMQRSILHTIFWRVAQTTPPDGVLCYLEAAARIELAEISRLCQILFPNGYWCVSNGYPPFSNEYWCVSI